MGGVQRNQISNVLKGKLSYDPSVTLGSFTDPQDLPSKGYVDSVAGGGASPSEPPSDGSALYWKMQEGQGAGLTLQDSSGNSRHAQTSTTISALDSSMPIAGKYLVPTGNDLYSATFNLSGLALSVEFFVLISTIISAGDQIWNYSQRTGPGAYSSVVAGLRFSTSATFQFFTTFWNSISTHRVPLEKAFACGYYQIPVGGGQVKMQLWVNGSLFYESAPWTPNTSSASHSFNLPSGGWNKSHFRVFDGERTDAQKKEFSDFLIPWLKRDV